MADYSVPTMSSAVLEPSEQSLTKTTYAGFWRRFLAIFIDSLILWSVSALIFGVHFTAVPNESGMYYYRNPFGLIIGWLYFAVLESSAKGATVGKMAMGIRVTDMSGNRLSFGRATGRYFAKILSAITLFIGFIMAGFTQKKQALHDIIASTLVLTKN